MLLKGNYWLNTNKGSENFVQIWENLKIENIKKYTLYAF